MDIAHAKMLKNDMDVAITKLVCDFEVQTGLEVVVLHQHTSNELGKSERTYRVESKVMFA
jgi:hypothetical protein